MQGMQYVFWVRHFNNAHRFPQGVNLWEQPHLPLERIQAEGHIGCEYISYRDENGVKCTLGYPRSLSYDEMDQSEFEEVFTAMCRHVAARYWPGLTMDQVAEMAELMGDQVA